MPEKWKQKKVSNRTYRGRSTKVPGRGSLWVVQYKDAHGNWKDTVNKSVGRRGKINRIFD